RAVAVHVDEVPLSSVAGHVRLRLARVAVLALVVAEAAVLCAEQLFAASQAATLKYPILGSPIHPCKMVCGLPKHFGSTHLLITAFGYIKNSVAALVRHAEFDLDVLKLR
ncbi:MAG: hypothetical protein K8F27_01700, partial [Sulfuricellaceae bacterium]|nr:hypothetical protein [Sulfuricellaceae bacterium]